MGVNWGGFGINWNCVGICGATWYTFYNIIYEWRIKSSHLDYCYFHPSSKCLDDINFFFYNWKYRFVHNDVTPSLGYLMHCQCLVDIHISINRFISYRKIGLIIALPVSCYGFVFESGWRIETQKYYLSSLSSALLDQSISVLDIVLKT